MFAVFENFVDETVCDRLFGGHVVVAVRVIFDLLDGLACVKGEDAIEAFFQVEHEADGALYIGSGTLGAAGNLVDHHMGVWQAEAFALGPCREKDGAHGSGDTDAVGVHIAGEELHGVIHRKSCGDRSAGGVDVDVDVLFGILHLQEQELCDHRVCDEVIDRYADENDAILEKPRVDVERAFAAAIGFDDDGHVVVFRRG